jgi:hypothetical protein
MEVDHPQPSLLVVTVHPIHLRPFSLFRICLLVYVPLNYLHLYIMSQSFQSVSILLHHRQCLSILSQYGWDATV